MTICKSNLKSGSTSIRFGSRVRLKLPVRLSVDGRTWGQGSIRNASISGALVETALDLPLHTNLVVTLTITGEHSPATRDLDACVVRLDPDGMGIEWRDMGGTDILDLLEQASDHAATGDASLRKQT
jgi:hypothetical protein